MPNASNDPAPVRNVTKPDIGTWTGPWRELEPGTIWADATGQKWRRTQHSRLKIGGSHANAGAKPQAIRLAARGDLSKVLHKALEIATSKRSKPRDVLRALEVLHRIGGMHSVTLLNADGDNATLPPIQVVENVVPVPGTSLLPGATPMREDEDNSGLDDDSD